MCTIQYRRQHSCFYNKEKLMTKNTAEANIKYLAWSTTSSPVWIEMLWAGISHDISSFKKKKHVQGGQQRLRTLPQKFPQILGCLASEHQLRNIASRTIDYAESCTGWFIIYPVSWGCNTKSIIWNYYHRLLRSVALPSTAFHSSLPFSSHVPFRKAARHKGPCLLLHSRTLTVAQ